MSRLNIIARCQQTDRARAFRVAFTRQTTGLSAVSGGVCASCAACRHLYDYADETNMAADHDAGRIVEEPHFSWRPCDTCGGLAGDRYEGHALDPAGGLVHLSMCPDCLCWTANGDLPDRWAS